MRMPFGQHRGKDVSEVPTEYLEWMLQEVEFRSLSLKLCVESELKRRARGNPGPDLHQDLEGKLKAWHREMALRWHPDRGGNTQAMQALNEGLELLRKSLIPGLGAAGNGRS